MSDPLPRLAVSKARLKGEVPDSEESERSSYQLTKLPVLMALSQQIASSEARGIQLSTTSGLGRPSADNQALSSLLLGVVQSKHIIKKRKSKKRALSGLSFHNPGVLQRRVATRTLPSGSSSSEKKAKNIVRVKREARPRLWELGNNKNSVLGKSPLQKN